VLLQIHTATGTNVWIHSCRHVIPLFCFNKQHITHKYDKPVSKLSPQSFTCQDLLIETLPFCERKTFTALTQWLTFNWSFVFSYIHTRSLLLCIPLLCKLLTISGMPCSNVTRPWFYFINERREAGKLWSVLCLRVLLLLLTFTGFCLQQFPSCFLFKSLTDGWVNALRLGIQSTVEKIH